jgi:alpha-tubulin suppressor-like RCC1 family protein
VRRLPGWLAPVLVPAILVAALGCREDGKSPTGPEPAPAPAITSTHALSLRQVSAGGYHTCGVTTDNRAFCWGYNILGQLGTGSNEGPDLCLSSACSTRPVAVLGGLYFKQVSAGNVHTCGVTTDNRAYCWGYGGGGELGDGTTTLRRLTPVAVLGGLQFRQVSTGGQHTCGVTTDDRAFCWGVNGSGQLGDSTEPSLRLTPSPVAGTRRWRQVDAGFEHTCGVTIADRAFCWGNGREGQIGNGKTYLSFWPRLVAGGLSFKRLTAGSWHSCGETTTNRAYCWGATLSDYGQLGDGDGPTTGHLTPVAVTGGLYFRQLSAGGRHTCGITSAAVTYCWGSNSSGQLGDGTTTNRLAPTPVVGPM